LRIVFSFLLIIIIILFILYGTDKGSLILLYFSSGKGLKTLILGDGRRRTGSVTTALESTDDGDSVDPHLEQIKNQACNEESDEEV
jgi:hypothetical protein